MGLYRRGIVWWMSFTYGGKQVRASTGQTDRRAAEMVLGETRRQLHDGAYRITLEQQQRTFGELMDRYLAEHASKKASARSYVGYARRLRGFFGDHTPLAEITPRLIVAYKNQLFAAELAPASVNRHLATLKKAFNLAVREWEWCQKNPVLSVSMEREPIGRDRWLTLEEEERLLSACPPWLRQIVLFALGTGLRMGEILAITWRAVDLSRRTVTVVRSKNGERRTLPINQTVLGVLKDRAKVRALQTDLVFPSQAQTPLEGSHLRRAFRSALKRARIDDCRFHDLRHTFATRLVQDGVDLYKVQRLLGHKTPLMTQRYAHHDPESLREGVEVLDRRPPVSHFITAAETGRAAEAM
ncbi:tyrosine-type recombinase/integrase [Nitrospira sp. Nam80]